ncbi:flagellar basal body rod protein FlgC [Ketogulonicigenium vulgare]|uniref:Flagellar basal-body rod protein FlgC n=1 Tax=Ketogulonicigenium vulgare (strain WSH-001) TaxID=759362 RepID=F9Y4F7_KETVW|nr:flagellar basal body rod protein FlgC [Ketogulonicigenium vulgare]ADO43491.1 flagellar basal-body rod protein FlgC [Ketogulonicigenium vulgare Y25]AEM41770.1 Flagellar basal-body rod protein FlgC [Ketogulonicigenium vulgare WSH-001]ALJ81876.1 flagellar basal-body rod protein FlgC [Ketogulonicigenium vulgare]ANW34527.1 flagellar basal body rod protein FlgC [Ketogulonicigenium vulgare]AOZ55526.1 flagellar basal-body rod protein FlgC [Ketogulonicigenium vulgare]
MADFSTTLSIAASGMQAQASRMRFTSENIANADTPGYHRKLVSFRAAHANDGTVEASRVRLDRAPLAEIYDPAHPLANDQGNYSGSNVDLLIEIADAREASRSYEANLKVFDQVRQMSTSLLDLLRR